MALEAINHLGYLNKKMIIILNDNEMSIDKNVGGMSRYLSSIIRNAKANQVKDQIEKIFSIFFRKTVFLFCFIRDSKSS